MKPDVICYLATTSKNPTDLEGWGIIVDYGLTKQSYGGFCRNSINNSTSITAIHRLLEEIELSKYTFTVFILGNQFVVKQLQKLSEKSGPIPEQNFDLWKSINKFDIKDVSWRHLQKANLPGAREVATLATSYIT